MNGIIKKNLFVLNLRLFLDTVSLLWLGRLLMLNHWMSYNDTLVISGQGLVTMVTHLDLVSAVRCEGCGLRNIIYYKHLG